MLSVMQKSKKNLSPPRRPPTACAVAFAVVGVTRHGMAALMAFLEILSGESGVIDLPLSGSAYVSLESRPILVTAPVTTVLPDVMDSDAEEQDLSTLGNFAIEEGE